MDLSVYLQFLLALVAVLALIGVLTVIARRVGLAPRIGGGRGSRRRLSLSEVLVVDSKHRLVLVPRDDVEHLLLLGPTHDLVVEQRIAPPGEPPPATRGTE